MSIPPLFLLSLINLAFCYDRCHHGGFEDEGVNQCLVELYYASFDEALAACKRIGGNLPSSHSIFDDYALSSTKGEMSCSTQTDEENNIWLGWVNGTWTDGTTVDYVGFSMGDTKYLVINREMNMWLNATKDTRAGTVCAYNPMSDGLCPHEMESGWDFNYSTRFNFCTVAYHPDRDFYSSGIGENSICHIIFNAHLPFIHSHEQNEYLFSWFHNSIKLLTKHFGFAAIYGLDWFWLGFDTENNQWLDGSLLDFRNFAPGEEEEIHNSTMCLTFETKGELAGLWNFRECLDLASPVCQTISK